ncbi:MAG: tetratricopeptide repeat protein [Actinobacteria bacterium]|nr:tetratricopeptide repeat protein [Actinomycetota bacterium]
MADTAETGQSVRLPVLGMTVAALLAVITVLAATIGLRWALPDPPAADAPDQQSQILIADGLTAYRAGDLVAAAEAFSEAIALAPDDAVAAYDLGTVREAQGDESAARDLYTRATELDPTFADAHFNLAVSQAAAGQDTAAISSYRRVLELQPDRSAALWNLGLLLHASGEPDEAVALLQQAVDLDPTLASRLPEGIDLG